MAEERTVEKEDDDDERCAEDKSYQDKIRIREEPDYEESEKQHSAAEDKRNKQGVVVERNHPVTIAK